MNISSQYLLLLLVIALLPSSAKGFEIEEKTRLGSTPPSCHNKCNECHPCFAVQVPTLPSHDRFEPSLKRVKLEPSAPSSVMDFYDPPGNRYSNYKPLGWKCRCNNHFYNP